MKSTQSAGSGPGKRPEPHPQNTEEAPNSLLPPSDEGLISVLVLLVLDAV